MSRGPTDEKLKKLAAYEKAKQIAALLGTEVEIPVETFEDKLLEANAVLTYYFNKGQGFKDRECRNCGLVFAYSWNHDSINYCSVQCIQKHLASIGIEWDPMRSWGDRYRNLHYDSRPAVISPQVHEIVNQILADTPEVDGDRIQIE